MSNEKLLTVESLFSPKEKIDLDPPKDDPITVEELSKADGEQTPHIYVSVKGTVFDVTRNAQSYGKGQIYSVFVAKDASRALAKSSLNPEDALPDYDDLTDKQKKVLDDWHTYFSKRYNVVGKLVR